MTTCKRIFNVIITIGLLFFTNGEVFAGKGYSSGGGRSYSSPSRSYSSPSRSYSSPKPSTSFSKPSTSSSGSKGYSSGSKANSHTDSTHQSTGPPSKSYSSGNSSSYSKKPVGNFQSLAATEQRKAESRAAYQKATAPKETYTTPKGTTVPIKKDDQRVSQIRNMSEDKWVTRETRVQNFYHDYYLHPPATVVHYNDPYSTFFWLWMLKECSFENRAYWAYCHAPGTPYEMDKSRYEDLLAKDKALEARVRQLEAEKRARDPNYVPPGMEPDLQYTDEFVNSAVNPTPRPHEGGGLSHVIWVTVKWCFYILLFCLVVVVVVWLVFKYKW